MKNKNLHEMFAYHLWANTHLLSFCEQLTEEQLTLPLIDGAYGAIRPTLIHMIEAEGYYVRRLTGSLPWDESTVWETLSINQLSACAQKSGNLLLTASTEANPDAPHQAELNGQPYYFANWTVLLQALYHGIEHRTQIKISLTQLNIPHPELSAWDYNEVMYNK